MSNSSKCSKKRYPTVLHLEFAILATWQMSEQTWQKCQVVVGFANSITRAKSRARKARAWRPSIFIICPVQIPIPLEMTYFYHLHFVMGVCKQQQMPSQFAKAFGDALTHEH